MSGGVNVHVIGAGLAGLSAALQLSLMGERVFVHEAAPYAGGRCRSYFDRALDCSIDNGNHLVLSGNVAVRDYLDLSGAEDTVARLSEPLFPFADLRTGERWTLRMGNGDVPLWIFDPARRVAGTRSLDYLSALRFLRASEDDTVAKKMKARTLLTQRLWEPVALSILNTELSSASARLLRNVFAQSFAAGGKACIPLVPKRGLSETFVVPCLSMLRAKGACVTFGRRLRALEPGLGNRVKALVFADGKVELGPKDWVILAVPAWVAQDLVPGLTAPDSFRSIVNVHYRVEAPTNPAGFTGLVNGLAEWVFVRPGVVSVTISLADRYDEPDNDKWALAVWDDLALLFDLDKDKIPPWRIVREKRATFAATPEQDKKRPRAYIGWDNLALAGDWTATELPSTIEGALRSGMKAAEIVMRWKATNTGT